MKKIKDFANIHFNQDVFKMNKVEKEKFTIYYSDKIKDEYWNYAYLSGNECDIDKIWTKICDEMKKLNRTPIIYSFNELPKQYEEIYTDVWLVLDNINEVPQEKAKIKVEIHKIQEDEKEMFLSTFMKGFSGENPDDPYSCLPEEYSDTLKQSLDVKENEYKNLKYLVKYNEKGVAVGTAVYYKDKAVIYNVATINEYQRNGICKELLTTILNDLTKLGVNSVCVITEKKCLY